MSFDKIETAARVRDIIKRQASQTVGDQVPRKLIGRMMSLDLPRLRGTVWFPGDEQPIEVSIFPTAVPAEWQHKQPSYVGDDSSTDGWGSIVVVERINSVLWVTHVLSGGQSALDFRTLNSSLILQKGADTVAGGPSANAAVDIAGDPHETFINCQVSNTSLLDGEAIEFGPFTTFNPGTPGPGFIEMSVTIEGCVKYYRFVSNPLQEYDYPSFTAARPSAWFTILPNQTAGFHETGVPYTETTDFELAITFRKTSYGNTDDFATFKEMWFRLIRRKSIFSTGMDARVSIRATNVQRARSLGGRELFMQERNISPELPMGRVGFDNSSHMFGQFSQQYLKDTFGRIVSPGGWGKFDWDPSESWQIRTGTAADYFVDGQYANINVNANNTYYEIGSPTTSNTFIDDIITFIVPATSTGAQVQIGAYAVAGTISSGDRYLMSLDFLTAGTISITFRKKVSGTVSTIGSSTATGLSYSPGSIINCRLQITLGPSNKYLRAKAWLNGTDEPEAWTKDVVDSSVTISAGSWSLYALCETGNTNAKPYVVKFHKIDGRRTKNMFSSDHPETWHNGPWRSATLRIANDLQKTWTCDGVITWDSTAGKLKWTGNIHLGGVGRNLHGLIYGKAKIFVGPEDTDVILGRLPTDPAAGGSQGIIQFNPQNGIPIAEGQSLWVAIPPGTGHDNLYPFLFLVEDAVTRDYELPEWAVMIAMRGPAGVSPEIRLGNGTLLDSWKALPYATNWSNFGGAFSTGQYRKEDGNVVRLKGIIKHTTTTGTGTFATLPTGFRHPTETQVIHVTSSAAGSAGNSRIDINTDGTMVVISHWSGGGSAYMSLDGQTFVIS